ncbi:hypothetical protein LYSHEL_20200 [Lysobacter helvus]|uniref:Uncharacterized protein n=2 Tax=Lysobacteraceae TaxID=32033 RepID=A0ABN6FTI5_9GAMM|nr:MULTISPECIES: hypothetical protein [Lysobacter]BCT92997.1 hypothetical protein LYSCAS_20210 [Lysobacter caseinilyticus]BCT96149.1 hypothetical protein LYSHEL_20200 [Lysobacter helvus]
MQQQTLASMTVTQDQEDAVLAAVRQIEAQLRGLVSLEAGDRKTLPVMGPECERFARCVIRQLQHNAHLVPPGLDLAGALADLAALDRMRRIDIVLQQLALRVADTMAALCSDVMDVAHAGHGLLKLFGDQDGLQGIRKECGYRHLRAPRTPQALWGNRDMRARGSAH